MKAPRFLTLLLLAALFCCAPALRFYLQDRERRCFKFDAPFSSRVIGERSIENGPGTAELSLEIKSAVGRTVYESHTADPKDSKFAFKTPDFHSREFEDVDPHDYEYEDYGGDASFNACLVLSFDTAVHKSGKRAVTFWIRSELGNHGNLKASRASEDSMGTVTRSLQDMHGTLQQMVTDLTSLQQRERRLVKRSKGTAQRLTAFAVIALVVLLSAAALQFVFFKSFFKSKKLI